MHKRLAELLRSVDLKPEVADLYPHQLSGGMKQRVCIAIAISLRPRVIIADEPTSALDVVVQRRVMQTLRRVQDELGASVILIGHDMGLMAQFAQRVAVMRAGQHRRGRRRQRHLCATAASVHAPAHGEPAVARSTRHVPGVDRAQHGSHRGGRPA